MCRSLREAPSFPSSRAASPSGWFLPSLISFMKSSTTTGCRRCISIPTLSSPPVHLRLLLQGVPGRAAVCGTSAPLLLPSRHRWTNLRMRQFHRIGQGQLNLEHREEGRQYPSQMSHDGRQARPSAFRLAKWRRPSSTKGGPARSSLTSRRRLCWGRCRPT